MLRRGDSFLLVRCSRRGGGARALRRGRGRGSSVGVKESVSWAVRGWFGRWIARVRAPASSLQPPLARSSWPPSPSPIQRLRPPETKQNELSDLVSGQLVLAAAAALLAAGNPLLAPSWRSEWKSKRVNRIDPLVPGRLRTFSRGAPCEPRNQGGASLSLV